MGCLTMSEAESCLGEIAVRRDPPLARIESRSDMSKQAISRFRSGFDRTTYPYNHTEVRKQ